MCLLDYFLNKILNYFIACFEERPDPQPDNIEIPYLIVGGNFELAKMIMQERGILPDMFIYVWDIKDIAGRDYFRLLILPALNFNTVSQRINTVAKARARINYIEEIYEKV